MSSLPIGEYALLSDRHSAALVSSGGSVDWLCMPRFDSPSIFAAILDDEAGHWSIRPDTEFRVEREYVAGSMVLLTTFHTSAGTLELRDALVLGDTRDPHSLGEHAPHLLARTATCTRGTIDVIMSFRARPEYGLVAPVTTAVDGGLVAIGGANLLTLSSTVPLEVKRDEANARFELGSGERTCFALGYSALGAATPELRTGPEISALVDQTVTGWQEWSELHQSYQGPWCDLVHHSGRVLQALSYQPTGAIVAAPTTSLPEQVGGERNWDYRYSWVRDASMTMQALWVAACPDEAYEFFDFMASAAAGSFPDQPLQIMFGIGGEHDLSERTLPHLTGWRASAPVRVGNGAWNQPQLDVYGELLDAAAQLRDQLGVPSGPTRDFLVGLADSAAARWHQPDNGIWEVRGEPRHFVHSKVMCWVALDRAITLADLLGAHDHVEAWKTAAEEIRAAVETQGWDEDQRSYTQSFGSPDLDATVLLLPIVGFLPPSDPRVLSS
ncbi:MAG: glycoside hydrolase family 15 protein, partial [Actinomycetota bacterium]|nr:glycoside hydrolase family 15 protein [Actinomycetota bacterium]